MLTNDVKALAPGQGCLAAFLDAHGKTMSLLAVYALEDRLWLELPAGATDKTLALLDHYLISEKAYLEAADEAFAVLSVQGPGARALLEGLAGRSLDLADLGHAESHLAGAGVRVIRRRDGPAPGYHCWVGAEHGRALWQALRQGGALPAGFEAGEALRVEAGVSAFGQDVDETVLFPETGLEALVSYTKGCYLGQEVVARVKYRGHVNRALTGFVVEGERVPAAGARILADGKEVGRITSAVRSFALDAPIALGYLRREHREGGTPVSVLDGETAIRARVATLPFVEPVG
jgi:folate-binding protein YgfZ